MKKCPNCQTDNPEQAKFCLECATPFGITPPPSTTAVNIGQGNYFAGEIRTQGGDLVVGDKVLGDLLINSVKIIFGADDQARAKELLARYLRWMIIECAPLRLAKIDQSAGQPGQRPLGLAHVYVDLNLDFRLPKKQTLAQYLAARQANKAEGELREAQDGRLATALEALACHPALVLLGAPGSGKSTFSTYLALSLAEAGLGHPAALERLGQDWKYGPLLPVRVTLRKFSESLPADLPQGRAAHLWQFIDDELIKCGLPKDVAPVIHDMAEKGGALFLLDGLDEIGEVARRTRVLEAVTEFIHNAGPFCRFLLTARPYAWKDLQPSPTELPVRYSLACFDHGQIQTFIDRWYQAVQALGWISAGDVTEKTTSLQKAIHRADLHPLAENPLLLTLMATLHTNRSRLPDDRADLYDEVVRLLLQHWSTASGAERSLLDALAMPSLKLDDLRNMLEQVAYEVHASQVGVASRGGMASHGDRGGTADISETALLASFRPLLGGSWDKAALMLTYIETRTGLLLGQGPRDGVRQFTFPHRSFQEYLAGCYLARQVDFNARAAALARAAPDHWREALVLAARRAGRERGVAVADELLHHQDVDAYRRKIKRLGESDWRAAVLAGMQLLELGQATLDSSEAARVVRERAAGWLAALLEAGALPVLERVQAGEKLALLGDPRDLEELVEIPAGKFWMGSDIEFDADAWEIEEPRHEVSLEAFKIGKYPVTVEQWQRFVAQTGYACDPKSLEGDANRPTVYVSWHDARAYCEWLTGEWRKTGRIAADEIVRLPSEAEREKASRGTDGRIWPWGNEFDHLKANVFETDIGHSSAVGCFPAGASPCGCLDMVGNVREWTSSLFKEYPYHPDDGREDPGVDGKRVRRGGAFDVGRKVTRCASRRYNEPDFRIHFVGFRVACSSTE